MCGELMLMINSYLFEMSNTIRALDRGKETEIDRKIDRFGFLVKWHINLRGLFNAKARMDYCNAIQSKAVGE